MLALDLVRSKAKHSVRAHVSMNERPTLRQIAELANVHHTTVSRALRNDRRIPLATKKRILEIAKKMDIAQTPC